MLGENVPAADCVYGVAVMTAEDPIEIVPSLATAAFTVSVPASTLTVPLLAKVWLKMVVPVEVLLSVPVFVMGGPMAELPVTVSTPAFVTVPPKIGRAHV